MQAESKVEMVFPLRNTFSAVFSFSFIVKMSTSSDKTATNAASNTSHLSCSYTRTHFLYFFFDIFWFEGQFPAFGTTKTTLTGYVIAKLTENV